MTSTPVQSDSPWPHRVAVVLVCTTFPLVWVGGLVTTYRAGMAVPDWPNTYGYNLFRYPMQEWIYGPWDLFIEHGHRLLGAVVGMLTIALVAVVWKFDSRRWMRLVSVAALLAVILQGALGGMRVVLDRVQLAKIHGCTGPAFFALAVAIAVFTSPYWRQRASRASHPEAGRLHRLALLTTAFAYVQLVLGSQLRHLPAGYEPSAFRVALFFHLIMAAVLTVHVVLLAMRVWQAHRQERALRRPAMALVVLITVQLLLGAGTWVAKYSFPAWLSDYAWAAGHVVEAESRLQAWVTTGHVATGSLILVTSLVVALRSLRQYRSEFRSPRMRPTLVEVAA